MTGVAKDRRSLLTGLLTGALILAAFLLYWSSSFVLEARDATTRFGADTWFYTELSKGNVWSRVAADARLDRILRFHPLTVLLATGWMGLFDPLAGWITPAQWLRALFALIGAAGVWAAVLAFAAFVPRRQALLWGLVYASTLGIWYFASIEESKIVSVSLSSIYIALYLHLRTNWTRRGALLLTLVLLAACLNEIVAIFLGVIPLVDTLMQRGWDWRQGRWIFLHGLAGPLALVVLELLARARTGAGSAYPDSDTHLSMFLWYVAQNSYSLQSVYEFVVRWVFFNLAAPQSAADYLASESFGNGFAPYLSNYVLMPAGAALTALLFLMIAAIVLPRFRPLSPTGQSSILLALFAYTLVRGTFFFIFLPAECLLYSPSVTLTHLLLIGLPFMASRFPHKGILLGAAAILLFIVNGSFVAGPPS